MAQSDMSFNVIDVETANEDRASICQIGIVKVQDGEIREQWKTLINPEERFDPWNVEIHGIDEQTVENSPTLPEVSAQLREQLQGTTLISHTAFDRVALNRALDKYGLQSIDVAWLDSARIVRRAWPDIYGQRGWGLKNVAKDFSISFKHHDALEDARAAAEIVLRACIYTGKSIEEWQERTKLPIRPSSSPSPSVKREGNVEGTLYGETVVFSGTLSIVRQEAEDMAAKAGCNVEKTVSKKVTMLVVGVQDKTKLRGHEKSSKQRKAESLIQKGCDIKILSENDFRELAGLPLVEPPKTKPAKQKSVTRRNEWIDDDTDRQLSEVERNELEECVKFLTDKYGVELSDAEQDEFVLHLQNLMDDIELVGAELADWDELKEWLESLMDKYGVELSALDWEGLEGRIKSLMGKYHHGEELSDAETAEIEEHLKSLMDKYNISREQAVDKMKAKFDSWLDSLQVEWSSPERGPNGTVATQVRLRSKDETT